MINECENYEINLHRNALNPDHRPRLRIISLRPRSREVRPRRPRSSEIRRCAVDIIIWIYQKPNISIYPIPRPVDLSLGSWF